MTMRIAESSGSHISVTVAIKFMKLQQLRRLHYLLDRMFKPNAHVRIGISLFSSTKQVTIFAIEAYLLHL